MILKQPVQRHKLRLTHLTQYGQRSPALSHLYSSTKVAEDSNTISPRLLQAKQALSPQPLLTGKCLSPRPSLMMLHLTDFIRPISFMVWGAQTKRSRAGVASQVPKRKNNFPQLVDHTFTNTAQPQAIFSSQPMLPLPSSRSVIPLSLVLSINLLRTHSIASTWVINLDFKQCWPQYQCPRDTSGNWLLVEICAAANLLIHTVTNNLTSEMHFIV